MYIKQTQDIVGSFRDVPGSPCTRCLSIQYFKVQGILTTASTPLSFAAGTPTAVSARLYALEQEEDEFKSEIPSKLNNF